jgi:hypothetical protein
MSGKAIDIRLPDVSTARLREAAMRLQAGGVGFYPGSDFVHVDTGSVRAWPRMSREQLARLFPDGKTVHLPSNGAPLAGYEQARAEILARREVGQATPTQVVTDGQNVWAALFGTAPDTSSQQTVDNWTGASVDRDSRADMENTPPLPPPRPRTLGGVAVASTATILPQVSHSLASAPAPGEADSLRQFFAPTAVRPHEQAFVYYAQARPSIPEQPSLGLSDAGILNLRFTPDSSRDLGYGRFIGPAVVPLPLLTLAMNELRG